MLIHLQDVNKIYTSIAVKFEALKGITLDIEEGDFTVLAGPSGSGKTTLLNIIGTLDAATEGTVEIDGHDISALTEIQKSDLRLNNIGFIFQSYNLINVLSAAENVEYVLQLQNVPFKERREKSTQLLKQVGMEGLENRKPEELSGGQQQRVAVARALASEPKLVIADEPTANLDQQTGKDLMDMMAQLNDELDITFIVSSHDQMVMKRARRLIKLVDGSIYEDKRLNGKQ